MIWFNLRFRIKWGLICENWSYVSGLMARPSDPNVISRPQTSRSQNFLRFHNFIWFILWFWRKWDNVYEKWSQSSGLMAWYVFWAKVVQMQFISPRPQEENICRDFIILLDLPNNSLKITSCLWKVEPGFRTYGLIRLPCPSGQNVFSKP